MIESFATYLAIHPIAELAFVMVILLIIGYIMQLLRQPSIVGYILGGIILSPQLHGIITNQQGIELFAQIGISLLLFLVGLWLSPKVIREVGKVAVVAWLWQIIFTSIVGFGIASLLGNWLTTSLFLAIWLTFSSTIIIVKLISDKSDTNTLYGKISLWILIVQDLIAMGILMWFALTNSVATSGNMSWVMMTIAGIVVTAMAVFICSQLFLKKLLNTFSQSQEYLLLFSLGWALLLGALFDYIGLTMEAGALVAGITLAESSKKFLIAWKIKPLRDFFIALFFVYIGWKLVFTNMSGIRVDVTVLSLFVLIGNPLIVFALMKSLRYDRKTSFMTGLTVAQISEFSFIIVGMGLALWFVKDESLLTTITFIGLITMTWSSYMFYYAQPIMKRLEERIPYLKHSWTVHRLTQKNYDVIIIGYGAHGKHLCHHIDPKLTILAVEYDPHIIDHTRTAKNVTLIHADATHDEIREELAQYTTKLVIVTSSAIETNLATYHFNRDNGRFVIGHASNEQDASTLYKEWIHAVSVSHDGAVEMALALINTAQTDKALADIKKTHLTKIEKYLQVV